MRGRFPEPVLLGTLAREEKINSAPFLRAVVDILVANPQAGFLWTGRSEHRGIAGVFEAAGVQSRCHFVGWVDTRLYAAALDLFLESFPLGTGVIPYQALGAGTPLLSYFSEATVFGVNFWHEFAGRAADSLEHYPILCARTPEEYVRLAGELISNSTLRAQVGARGRRFFEEELSNHSKYSKQLFDTISEIAQKTLAPAARNLGRASPEHPPD